MAHWNFFKFLFFFFSLFATTSSIKLAQLNKSQETKRQCEKCFLIVASPPPRSSVLNVFGLNVFLCGGEWDGAADWMDGSKKKRNEGKSLKSNFSAWDFPSQKHFFSPQLDSIPTHLNHCKHWITAKHSNLNGKIRLCAVLWPNEMSVRYTTWAACSPSFAVASPMLSLHHVGSQKHTQRSTMTQPCVCLLLVPTRWDRKSHRFALLFACLANQLIF